MPWYASAASNDTGAGIDIEEIIAYRPHKTRAPMMSATAGLHLFFPVMGLGYFSLLNRRIMFGAEPGEEHAH